MSIEDTRELRLPHENWLPNLTRIPELSREGEIDMYRLLRQAMRQRRFIKHTMHQRILEAFAKEKDVKIASVTIDIVGFPPVRTAKDSYDSRSLVEIEHG
ncbi:hypothetical protein ig2599ANME_0470 [groundwater metagenome]